MRLFASPAARRKALAGLLVLAAGFAATTLLVGYLAPDVGDPAALRETIAGFGPYAPLAFVALQAVQVLVAPVPGQALGFVSGYLFGTVYGTLYSVVGVAVGSLVAFRAARRYGRRFVESVVDEDALARFDDFVARHGTVGLFVAFLFPAFPDDLLCLVAGLARLRTRTLLALVVVGRAPTFLVAASAGSAASRSHLGASLALVGGLAVVSLAVYLLRERLVAALPTTGGGGPRR